jgi:Domain of Unknown Function (DUF1206)
VTPGTPDACTLDADRRRHHRTHRRAASSSSRWAGITSTREPSRNFLDDPRGPLQRPGATSGHLLIVAASRSEPNKATGLDGALKTLGAQPYGAGLLIAAGIGIITYGLYSFAMARYTKCK